MRRWPAADGIVGRGVREASLSGAIKLALEAGADDRSQLAVIRAIVSAVPDPPEGDVASVRRFLAAVRASKAEFHVTGPPGRIGGTERG